MAPVVTLRACMLGVVWIVWIVWIVGLGCLNRESVDKWIYMDMKLVTVLEVRHCSYLVF